MTGVSVAPSCCTNLYLQYIRGEFSWEIVCISMCVCVCVCVYVCICVCVCVCKTHSTTMHLEKANSSKSLCMVVDFVPFSHRLELTCNQSVLS